MNQSAPITRHDLDIALELLRKDLLLKLGGLIVTAAGIILAAIPWLSGSATNLP